MSVSTPLLDTIEPDEPEHNVSAPLASGNIKTPLHNVVLTPTNRQMATTDSDAEAG